MALRNNQCELGFVLCYRLPGRLSIVDSGIVTFAEPVLKPLNGGLSLSVGTCFPVRWTLICDQLPMGTTTKGPIIIIIILVLRGIQRAASSALFYYLASSRRVVVHHFSNTPSMS